jgi:hypothetical protein
MTLRGPAANPAASQKTGGDDASDVLLQLKNQFEREKAILAKPPLATKSVDDKALLSAMYSRDSPDVYIYSMSYTSTVTAGGTQNVGVTFYSYKDRQQVIVSCFFGIGQFLKDVGHALASRDREWPFIIHRYNLHSATGVDVQGVYFHGSAQRHSQRLLG